MLLHSSQTSAGMTPAFINSPNSQQPAQSPKIDSSEAKTSRTAARARARRSAPKPYAATVATVVSVRPMA